MIARRVLLVLMSLMIFAGLAILPGCGEAETPAPAPPAEEPAEAPSIDEAAELIEVTNEYLSSEFSQNWVVNAADLNDLLFVKNDDSFQLIDVRSPEHYAAGHIEGAINIPYETIVDEDQLAKLNPDKTQLVVDYDGSKATGVVCVYSQLGYEAMFLRFGISGWTTDPALYGIDGGKVWDGVGADYPVTTEGFTAEPTFDLPTLDTGAADVREVVINATKAFLARGGNTNLITATELNGWIEAGADDFMLITAVSPEHYALGHPEGAINIGRAKLATEGVLKQFDPDKKIVVTCYQGHNSGFMQMFLGQLGYDVYAQRFGLGAWTNNAEVRGVPMYDPAKVQNFPVVTGQ
ncbi:MAG: rhodanese-like domain-containing protein [Clostridiales bacterium]|nr:rhodanese-like domain-containing protein [Clostridiales bacterium]